MANRNFPSNKAYSMHVMVVELDAQIAIGASGAPAAITAQNAAGIKSIVRNSAGTYTIQLQDNYAKVLAFEVGFQSPSGSVSGIASAEMMSYSNSSNPSNNNGASIQFHCLAPTSSSVTTPVATDPANGSVMQIRIKLNNSQVQ